MFAPFSIAHYKLTCKIGEGGMGAVYRAIDTKLNREVAIKMLPPAFAEDAVRMMRFEREAQVLASLNHPNIAAIYGVEERSLVLELVEGETLKGPLPLAVALDYARQIAGALEYAHEKGVVHRDLKPANIKVTPDGVVKVLDFGLAKAMDADAAPGDPTVSPTITMGPTMSGVILGTAGYMSPEQAKGKSVDRRADIWAFGVVLWEMLSGKELFEGETISDILAQVLTKEPAWCDAPAAVSRVLQACLQRDPKQRLKSIGDWQLLLDETRAAPMPLSPRSSKPWIVAVLILAVALAVTGWGWWRATRPVDHPLTRLSVDLGPEAMPGINLTAAISPDGRRLVFPVRGPDGNQQLGTRLLEEAHTRVLPGTEDGRDPFVSPDGQWIGFVTATQLKKVAAQGGPAETLTAGANNLPGASWGADGSIFTELGTTFPILRFPPSGKPQAVTKLRTGEFTHRWPQALPGGDAILFTSSASATALDNANIAATSLKTGETKTILHGGYYGRYVPSGHLLYVHQGLLYGVRFDPGSLEAHGVPIPLVEDLAANPFSGGGQFDFSNTGTLVYLAGKTAAQGWETAWLDDSGKMTSLMATRGAYPRLSPDGHHLAFVDGAGDVYVYDLDRDTKVRLTFAGSAGVPVWAPDGKHIGAAVGSKVMWIGTSGAEEPYQILDSPNLPRPWSFSPDGRWLVYFERSPETGFDLLMLPLDLSDPEHPKPGKPEPFLRTPADELVPVVSPDGHWVAYRSNEGGGVEICVRPFPAGRASRWQVSTGGGLYAVWGKNGHQLFYEAPDNRIMVLDYTVDGSSFVPGKPRRWSDKQLLYFGTTNLDLAPDGKRFVVFSMPEMAAGEKHFVHVTMLFNFFDELKRRIP